MSTSARHSCERAGLVAAYAMDALAPAEVAGVEAHLAGCAQCRRELELLRPLVDSFGVLPTDLQRPGRALQARLSARIAADTGGEVVAPPPRQYTEPEWEDVAPGIAVKMLAMDPVRHRVSMLVRLVPGGEYPPHTHAGVEELHLLAGELWIDDRKLYPGDYNHAVAGTGDRRVWSETGCTCVLITSTRDVLG